MAVDTPDDEPKSERFNMFISRTEMDAIEEWAWKNRVRSKSEAVRRLVQIGLRASRALPSIAKDVAEVLDLASEAIDIPEEIHAGHVVDELETVSVDREIASKLYDAVNFTFNRQIEAQDNLFHLLVEISQFANTPEFDAALEAADDQADSSVPNEKTLVAIGASRRGQLEMWRKRRHQLAEKRAKNLEQLKRSAEE